MQTTGLPSRSTKYPTFPRSNACLGASEATAVDLLEMAGLEDEKDQHPSRLSGGQQQRVAIARALAMRRKVMPLDEVTSALAPGVIGEVLNVIR